MAWLTRAFMTIQLPEWRHLKYFKYVAWLHDEALHVACSELGYALSTGTFQEVGQYLEAAAGRRGARHAGQPQQCICEAHERFAPVGKTSCAWFQNRNQLYRHCVIENVQAQAFAKQSAGAGLAQIQRVNPTLPLMSSSTQNGIELVEKQENRRGDISRA